MTNLLDLFKNIDSQEGDIKHTLEVMFANSGVTQIEDTAWYYQNQEKVVLQNSNIKSIEPLRYLTEVKVLVLNNNQISDITPLFELPKLQHLNLISNDISSVEGIDKLRTLEELYLGLNLLKDITPLSKLHNLKCLGLRGNTRISDVTPLNTLTNLVQLNLCRISASKTDIGFLLGALPGCNFLLEAGIEE